MTDLDRVSAVRRARVRWLAYAIVIVLLTTAPFRFTRDRQIVGMKLDRVSMNPLFDPWRRTTVAPAGVALNILFFMPFGALGRRATGRGAVTIAALGLILSAGVESAQVFTRDRIPSTADLVANTSGALAGAWAATGRATGRERLRR